MKRINNKHVHRLGALLAADLLFFGLTNSAQVPSIFIIIGFCLLSLTLYQVIYGLIGLLGLYGLPVKRRHRSAIYVTVVVGVLLALQSIGELVLRDIMVMTPLAVIGYMYAAYSKNTRRLEG